ncbi:hypothetical protein GCM10009529_09550 [Micropruina glycogenica]
MARLSAQATPIPETPPLPGTLTMRWVNVADFAPPVMGSPVVVTATGQPAINRRAASEVFESNGGLYIRVVAEPRWWIWIESPADERTPWPARSRVVPAMHVWTQVAS